jgi:hypothetical protein
VWCKPDTGMDLARTDFDARRDRQLDVDVGQRFRHLWIHRAAVRMAFSLSGLRDVDVDQGDLPSQQPKS